MTKRRRFFGLMLGVAAASAVCAAWAETFPSGTTVIATEQTYATGEELLLETGARVTVASGGSIAYSATSVSDATTPVLTLGPDTELKVQSGGLISFSDFAGLISLVGTEGNPARLTIDGGRMLVAATRYSGNYLLGRFHLGVNSILSVENGGTLEFSAVTDTNSPRLPFFAMDDGEILFSGTSKFTIGDLPTGGTFFSCRRTEFSGSSVLDFTGGTKNITGCMIGNGKNSATLETEVVFKDHASTRQASFAYPTQIVIANQRKGSWSHLRLHSDGTIALGALTLVSVASSGSSWKGGATLSITNGYAQSGGNYGIIIGHVASETAGSLQYCTGIVEVAGGTLVSRAVQGGSASGNTVFCGTIVGNGPALEGDEVYGRAELNVSSGIYTNWFGYFAVGVGRAYGRVMQTGGEIRSTPIYARPMMIGFAGGSGEFIVSNGVTTASTDVYVGGAPSDAFSGCRFRASTGDGNQFPTEDYTRGGAVGRLTVSAADPTKTCSFTATASRTGNPGHLHVGKNGTGEVEVGPGGALTVNGASFGGAPATLRCTLGASGAGTFRVNGDLEVEAGTKLVVDAREYAGQSVWVRLVNADSRTGDFSDVTVLGRGEVVQNRSGDATGSVWLYRPHGFGMVIR